MCELMERMDDSVCEHKHEEEGSVCKLIKRMVLYVNIFMFTSISSRSSSIKAANLAYINISSISLSTSINMGSSMLVNG